MPDDLTPRFRLARALTEAWPDSKKITELVGQSEESIEVVLHWMIDYARLLTGFIARAEDMTAEEGSETIDRLLAKLDEEGGY